MQHPFEVLKPEYESLLSSLRVTQQAAVNATAMRLLDKLHRPRLEPVCVSTGVPLPVWSAICERESGCDFTKNPAQGDPLTHPSQHVPAGRPSLGAPPNDRFPVSYEYAAIDAINYDHLNDISVGSWTMAYACWKAEAWNGFGPRNHGFRTGYLWAGTNAYTGGKYVADGVWSPTAWDQQLGVVPIMLRMIELDPSLSFGGVPIVSASPLVPVTPTPEGLGGGTDGIWTTAEIQRALVALGFGPLIPDGNYGRRTREAVRSFQTAHGLTPDGLVGKTETIPALDAAVAALGNLETAT